MKQWNNKSTISQVVRSLGRKPMERRDIKILLGWCRVTFYDGKEIQLSFPRGLCPQTSRQQYTLIEIIFTFKTLPGRHYYSQYGLSTRGRYYITSLLILHLVTRQPDKSEVIARSPCCRVVNYFICYMYLMMTSMTTWPIFD